MCQGQFRHTFIVNKAAQPELTGAGSYVGTFAQTATPFLIQPTVSTGSVTLMHKGAHHLMEQCVSVSIFCLIVSGSVVFTERIFLVSLQQCGLKGNMSLAHS